MASIGIWLFHFLILRGVKQAAFINTVVTFAKAIPIMVFVVILLFVFKYGTFRLNIQRRERGLHVSWRRVRLRPQHLYEHAAAQGGDRGGEHRGRGAGTRARRWTLHDVPDHSRCGGLLALES